MPLLGIVCAHWDLRRTRARARRSVAGFIRRRFATKLDAFKGRGRGDFFGSRDLEDLVSVVDGRASLIAEVQAESAELSSYVRTEINRLLGTAEFVDALPGYLLPDAVSQSRTTIILKRLKQLATM
jgi:hypothetical protein